jgi:hypothetical protein
LRFVYSRVESIGPDEQDPSSDAIRLYGVPGLANPSMRIAHDQIDSFLAILGFQSETGLIGCSVRVTVDDEKATEVITFLTKVEPVSAVEPMAFSPYQQPAVPLAAVAEPAVAPVLSAAPAVEPAAVEPAAVEPAAEPETMAAPEPAEAGEPVAAAAAATTGVAEPLVLPVALPIEPVAAAVEPATVTSIEPDEPTLGAPVMAAAPPPDEITVYDGVVVAPAPAAQPDETCDEPETSILPAEQDLEEKARVELAAAATAPITERYFLYRETYDQQPRPSVIEVTSGEFAQLGGSGSYLHVDDCSLIGAHDLPPETAQGIERLLERAMSRPEADLPRAELERLAVSGHVVSCAVY